MENKQYDKALKLITETTKNIGDLNDLLKSPIRDKLTEDEQKNLRLSLLKLSVIIKEFGK